MKSAKLTSIEDILFCRVSWTGFYNKGSAAYNMICFRCNDVLNFNSFGQVETVLPGDTFAPLKFCPNKKISIIIEICKTIDLSPS